MSVEPRVRAQRVQLGGSSKELRALGGHPGGVGGPAHVLHNLRLVGSTIISELEQENERWQPCVEEQLVGAVARSHARAVGQEHAQSIRPQLNLLAWSSH